MTRLGQMALRLLARWESVLVLAIVGVGIWATKSSPYFLTRGNLLDFVTPYVFIGLMALSVLQRLRGQLESGRPLLWALMLAFPFPFIANTAGWITAELGRQPWLVYGLYRTDQGYSTVVSSGDVLFTLIGMAGMYFVLGLLYLYLIGREVAHGPDAIQPSPYGESAEAKDTIG